MTAELRFGVIGTGMMGMEHIRHLQRMPDVRVTACADPDAGSRARAAAALPGVPVVDDAASLLARDDIDAVIVASPNFTHARVLDAVFASGKHVLVEKPLCTTLADAQFVAARAATHPGVFWVGLEYRYSAPMQRLIAAVHDGAIGRLRTLSIREHRNPFLVKVGNWNRFSRNTGGTLVEKCCHFFDLMRFITRSEPTRVYASGAQDVNHLDERYDGETPDILDNAFVTVDFDDGSRALLDLCMFAEAGMNHEDVIAIGDRGKAQCLLPQGIVAIGERATKVVRRERVPMDPALLDLGGHYGATWGELARFCAAVRGDGPVEVSARDGLLSVAMGVAAQRSIEERRVVTMAEVLEPPRGADSGVDASPA